MKKHAQKYFFGLINHINELPIDKIEIFAKKITEVLLSDGTIYVIGNGGSAATASHFVCDLNKTVLTSNTVKSKRLKVICLSDNIPQLTAWANDYSYDYVFSEPLKNFANKNDLLVAITGSGNSKNIVNALKEANNLGLSTFGILGFDGGQASKLAKNSIIVEADHYGYIEDIQVIILHLITDYLKRFF